jgi:IMP cyclohydrolase
MKTLQDIGRTFTYPGRYVIAGMIQDQPVLMYGVTGRNPASCAKRYVHTEQQTIVVESTDMDVMATGDLSLLDYTAGKLFDDGFILGNGRQTDCIEQLHAEQSAQDQLDAMLGQIEYEDDKYCTPRITAAAVCSDEGVSLALHHAYADEHNQTMRASYDIAPDAQTAAFLSTYAGPNVRPTPAYTDAPIAIAFSYETIDEAARAAYDAFAPQGDEQDLRVSVVAVLYGADGVTDTCILNTK